MHQLHETQWLPLMTRVEMVNLPISFANKPGGFPYDADTLASALWHMKSSVKISEEVKVEERPADVNQLGKKRPIN